MAKNGSLLKAPRSNKVIGLAIGERSLSAAEVVAGERPQATHLAEFIYPQGLSLQDPAGLGKALGEFLRQQQFTARTAVVGLPARWLVVKPKEVPSVDPGTLAEMLRLQAEGEFSSELKDLVYDYVGGADSGETQSILLIATQKKYVEAAGALCESAHLSLAAVTPSAVALGSATGRSLGKDSLVLAVGSSGAELSAQSGGSTSAIRHLRSGAGDRPFMGELRRAVSSLPSNGTGRELVMWDSSEPASMDAQVLGENLGFAVRNGDLPTLGVDSADAHSNGEGRKFATAVALALAGTGIVEPSVDFLHTRLAAPKARRIPRWAILASVAAVVLIGCIVVGYVDLQQRQTEIDTLSNNLKLQKSEIDAATAFVAKVSFAQGWHGENPRYLACLRDLTVAIPQDYQTFATALTLHDNPRLPGKATDPAMLAGTLSGKTGDQQRVQVLLDSLKRNPAFSDVELINAQDAARLREVSFSINFKYLALKTTP